MACVAMKELLLSKTVYTAISINKFVLHLLPLFDSLLLLSMNLIYCEDDRVCLLHSAAPTGPPMSFHVVVLNSTSVEVQYNLPLFELRNGIIRGYKIFVVPADGSEDELVIEIMDITTFAYIIMGLKPATAYIFSMLAYTVADGPRSIHLTAITHPTGRAMSCMMEVN